MYLTIRVQKRHLQDLKDLLKEKEAISDKLVEQGKGHEACDMNELADAIKDLIEMAR